MSNETDRLLLDAMNVELFLRKLAMLNVEAQHRLALHRSHEKADRSRATADMPTRWLKAAECHVQTLPNEATRSRCDPKANRGPACQPKLWLNTAKPCHPRWSRWRPIARLQAR